MKVSAEGKVLFSKKSRSELWDMIEKYFKEGSLPGIVAINPINTKQLTDNTQIEIISISDIRAKGILHKWDPQNTLLRFSVETGEDITRTYDIASGFYTEGDAYISCRIEIDGAQEPEKPKVSLARRILESKESKESRNQFFEQYRPQNKVKLMVQAVLENYSHLDESNSRVVMY